MHQWIRRQGMMGDDPPYLAVGTEVSAKYKGAFCEAKVRKVVRSVKCKITFKHGLGSAVVSDDQIKGTLRVGSICEVKHPEKKEVLEATINRIQDCSQYTVVFDDGDITTLKRTALCLKSGRHFAESETLDQLPLTHPEHFGNPVIGGRKGRRSRQTHEDSSDEEDTPKKGKKKEEKEENIGKVVCVELGDKKKQKDNWFPGLVVSPTAQDTVRIRVRDEYLVRSFKDGRYFTVPKKEATEFTREIGLKVDNNTLKAAVEKALLFLDKDELPPHWDRDLLFSLDDSSGNSDGGLESDSSDDEPREEKDHFVAQLYKFMDDRGTPINKAPVIGSKDVDLYKLFKVVDKLGGYNRVTNHNQWKTVSHKVGFGQNSPSMSNMVKQAYKKFLHSFEDFYRKLGCTMVNHPRGNRSRHRSGRSLIRDRDRNSFIYSAKEKEKQSSSSADKASTADKTSINSSNEKTSEKVETSDKETSKPDKKDVQEKTEEDKKSKTDENIKSLKDPKKDKSKAKEEKIEAVICKDEKKIDKSKSKVDQLAAIEKPKSKEDKPKIPEPKIEIDEREDRIRNREAKKEEKSKDKEIKNKSTDEKSNVKKESEVTRTDASVSSTQNNTSGEIIPKKEEKIQVKETKAKGKEMKAKKEEKQTKQTVDKAKPKDQKEEKVEEKAKVIEKIKEEKPKPIEEEKLDETKKKLDKKPEDDEKHTRSKSKEDLKLKKENVLPERRSSDTSRESSKLPMKDVERKPPFKFKRSDEEIVNCLKKRGRKRKDTDEKCKPEEHLGQLASNVNVNIGDKLKVYYGPTHESKVTYEAKVLDIDDDSNERLYLVHYTGWNTRYDEWIKRSRIAENLSWTPARAKRFKQQQLDQQHIIKPVQGKRGRPSVSSRSQEGPQPRPRSTTPSSVTSSSSHTKSPATRQSGRLTRNSGDGSLLSQDFRRRTRRMSGHTDISVASDSESGDYSTDHEVENNDSFKTDKEIDSDEDVEDDDEADDEDEDEDEIIETKEQINVNSNIKLELVIEKDDEIDENSEKLTKKKPVKQKESDQTKVTAVIEECSKEEKQAVKKELVDISIEQETSDDLPTPEKRRSKRNKKFGKCDTKSDSENVETNVTTEEYEPKGRDFDLNEIRSELKGIDKAVKLPHEIEADLGKKESSAEDLNSDAEKIVEIEKEPVIIVEQKTEKQEEAPMEDVYEFKEPEPFEFEVRTKRDGLIEGKLPRRTLGRIFDDIHDIKTEKSPRKKPVKSPDLSAEEIVQDLEPRKRFRRVIGKKSDEPVDEKQDTTHNQEKISVVDSNPVKIQLISSPSEKIEKVAETLLLSISQKSPKIPGSDSNTTNTQIEERSPVLEHLSLFSENQEDDGEDENEDRLVISETDDMVTEIGEPLFSYHQRDHLELFPTLSTPTPSTNIETTLPQISPNLKSNESGDIPSIFPFKNSSDTIIESKVTDAVRSLKSEVQTENAEKSIDQPTSEVVNLFLKEGDEYEDDTINTAIQRVINQTVLDEDTNDTDIFNQRHSVKIEEDVKIKVEVSSIIEPFKSVEVDKIEHSEKENFHPKFIDNSESSDTDSSDEEQRLVIAKEDDDDVIAVDEASSSSTQSCPKLLISDSGEFVDPIEEKLQESGSIPEEIIEKSTDEIKEPSVLAKIENVVDDNDIKDRIELQEKCEEVVTVMSVDINVETTTTKVEELPKSPPVIEISEFSVKEEPPESGEVIISPENTPIDVQEEEPLEKTSEVGEVKTEEVDCNLYGSLLCEETIPGSPAPVNEIHLSDPCHEVPTESKVLVLEMPFASAPNSNCSPPSTTVCSTPPSNSTVAVKVQTFVSCTSETIEPTLPPLLSNSTGPTSPVATQDSLSNPGVSKKTPSEAAPVMDNTPPTTPDSSLSTISGSPRDDRDGLSPNLDNESTKSQRDSFDMDIDSCVEGNKVDHYSEEDSLLNVEETNLNERHMHMKLLPKSVGFDREKEIDSSPKKRRRSRKRSESESCKRMRHSSNRNIRHLGGNCSDSDDTSENSAAGCTPPTNSDHPAASRSPRPSRYNFYVELDPELDGSQRIALLQQKLQELRKTYMTVKAELACIDRRRKKLRRREREEKATKSEVTCS